MNQSKISVRYAKALFKAAVEENNLDKVMKDILLVREVIKIEAYQKMLDNPVITTIQKKEITKTVFEEHLEILTFNFLNLLLINSRESYISSIIRNFQSFYRENKGINAAQVYTATEIDEQYRKKFKTILEKTFKTSIELEEIIKPGLIGGFILKVEDEQYDASVSTSLSRIKKRLIETPIEKN